MSGLGTIPAVSSSGSLMTNYARIGHAAQQVFPDILQDIIAIKEPQHCLYGDVTGNRYLTRNLRADEWSMINNVRTNGYVNFDIPLIYKLVRNLNLVPPPSKGWDFHMDPTVTEILPGDDIERIRRTRNEILHRGNAQVSDINRTDYFTSFKDIASRLEAYLGKPKGELVQKFQNLENCCMDEETEKTYLERLTLLRERDINLTKAVENIQKDLDSLLYKESHQILIEEWEEQNKLFIKTDAVDVVLKYLIDNNCCTVIGTSGIGKSATIHHVALFLRDTEGYRIIPIHSPSEIEKYFQRNRNQIFVIDDICGKYSVIQTEVEKWIKRNKSIQLVQKYNSTKVIASCRIQVFNENQFKRLKLFTENFCNLSSDTFHLSSQVRLEIARQYLPEPAVEYIKNDLDKCEFLPFMFTLYTSLCKGKEHFDVVKFFKNPFHIYTKEIDELHLLLDKTKFCALFFLVICNGSLNVSLLTSFESEQERQKREDFFEECGIPRNTLRQRILEQLESLVPLFVRSNYDLSRQVISFSAMHDKTFDFLCFYFGKKFQKSFLRFADSEILYERTKLKSLISPDNTVEDFTVQIADFNAGEYFNRIIDQWSRGDLVSIFYSRQMDCEKYRNTLIGYLNKLPEERRKELITIEKNESFVKFNYIQDGCVGSFPLSPLSLAFKRNFSDLIQFILNFVQNTEEEAYSILLIKACSAGLTDVVRILIHKGSNMLATDMNGCTPLMAACKDGHYNIIELLLRTEASVNQAVLEKVKQVNVSNKSKQTPLILSCINGNIEIVRLLIDKGADVNFSGKRGQTPLIFSCIYDNIDIVRLLIDKGADVDISDEIKETPLLYSSVGDKNDIFRLLIEKGANFNVSGKFGETPLMWYCKINDSDIVRLLIEKGAQVNVSDIYGQTALMWSCKNKNNDIVRLLIEKGAGVNVSDTNGYTPLLWSCKKGNMEIVQLLIEKEADINVSDSSSQTPLILSCKKSNCDIARLLIEKGANVNASDRYGQTPLMWSCENDNSDIIRLLIEKGADVNASNTSSGYTPLIWSCEKDNIEIVQLLIEKGAGVNVSDMNSQIPLIRSCENNNIEIVRLLIENGADVDVSDMLEETPLICSCKYGNINIAQLLLEKGAGVNVSDKSGVTPLMLACVSGNCNTVRLLLDKNADVNVRASNGMTALSYVCISPGYHEIAKELLLKGADVVLANAYGETPLMYANENKYRQVDNCLRKHLYKSELFDRKRKAYINLTGIANNYEHDEPAAKVTRKKYDIN